MLWFSNIQTLLGNQNHPNYGWLLLGQNPSGEEKVSLYKAKIGAQLRSPAASATRVQTGERGKAPTLLPGTILPRCWSGQLRDDHLVERLRWCRSRRVPKPQGNTRHPLCWTASIPTTDTENPAQPEHAEPRHHANSDAVLLDEQTT